MKHLLSFFYVSTNALFLGFVLMALWTSIIALFVPVLWDFVIPASIGCGIGNAIIQPFLHGRPLDDGSVYNPWKSLFQGWFR